MILYHGTTARCLVSVLKDGLKPRGPGKKGNWQHSIESNPHCVYLTDAYAPYFAVQATRSNDKGMVIEVDTHQLNGYALLPDEDVLEQAGRGYDDVKGDMKARTKWYRKNIHQWAGGGAWTKSLEVMGTCCFYGTIPPKAITRIALIPPEEMNQLFWHFDCSISLMNYHILKDVYRAKSRRLFGERVPFNALTFNDPRIPYSNIRILTLKEGDVASDEIISVPDERDMDRLREMSDHHLENKAEGEVS